ncbi:MAG: HEAT repeat domain-containing protein [Dehalococcoidia bacterium]
MTTTDCETNAAAVRDLTERGDAVPTENLDALQRCIEEEGDSARQRGYVLAYVPALDADRLATEAHRLLAHKDADVREAAYDALSELGPRVLPALEGPASDKDRDVRWFAYEIASHLEGTAAIPMLLRGLHDGDFSIRWVASNGLISTGPESVRPLLEALVTERPSLSFHSAARRIFTRIDASSPLDEQVRRLADALGRETTIVEAGPVAKDILDRLYGGAAAS